MNEKFEEDYLPTYFEDREPDPDPIKDLNVVVQDTRLMLETASVVLNKYARAHDTLGNKSVADDFFALSDAFQKSAKRLFDAHNKEYMHHIDASIQASEKNMGAILSGLLNMKPGDDVKTSVALSFMEANYESIPESKGD